MSHNIHESLFIYGVYQNAYVFSLRSRLTSLALSVAALCTILETIKEW